VAGLIDRLVRALSGDPTTTPMEREKGSSSAAPRKGRARPASPLPGARRARETPTAEAPTAEAQPAEDARPGPPPTDGGAERKLREARAEIEALERRLRTAERERAELQQRVSALDEERLLLEGRVADLARSEKRAEDGKRDAETRLARRSKRATEPDTDEHRDALERRARSAELSAKSLALRLADAEARLRAQASEASRPADDLEPRASTDADTSRLDVFFSPGPDCLEAILDCLHSARTSVDVCVFTITDDRIADALLEAHDRRVSVRIITDNDKASDRGSDVWKLERAGVAVRVDRTEFHMHHKFAVFDGALALTGSYNWTRGAFRDNEENLVVCDSPRFVAAFREEFERLWDHLRRDT
jgi:mitochondrial cardiolipin hydrolase